MATTLSPVRLTPEARRAMQKHYSKLIKLHGLSHAVNVALSGPLGFPTPPTPAEKMGKASKRRWRTQKAAKRAGKK